MVYIFNKSCSLNWIYSDEKSYWNIHNLIVCKCLILLWPWNLVKATQSSMKMGQAQKAWSCKVYFGRTCTWPSPHKIRKVAGFLDTLKRNCAWPWRKCDVYHTNDESINGIYIFINSMTQTWWRFLRKQDISIWSIYLSLYLSIW